jgi:hypothetical protein
MNPEVAAVICCQDPSPAKRYADASDHQTACVAAPFVLMDDPRQQHCERFAPAWAKWKLGLGGNAFRAVFVCSEMKRAGPEE